MNRERIDVSWTQFKDFVDTRDVSPQFITEGNIYLMRATDNFFTVGVRLKKENMSDTEDPNYKAHDQAAIDEFIETYLALSNAKPDAAFVRHMSDVDMSISPRTVIIEATGATDKKIESTTGLLSLLGVLLCIAEADWDFKDTLAISVIDKDDVLGLGGTSEDPTVYFILIPKNTPPADKGEWGIAPNIWNELIDESISSPIPDGLYIRVEYIKDGGLNTPKAILNLNSYEV